MNIGFSQVLITIIFLVIFIIPGFILAKTGLIGEKADAAFSSLVLYVCQPMLIFMSFQKTEYNPNVAVNILIVAVGALVIHLLMIGFVYLVIRNKENSPIKNCARFASVFSNCGYMGIPFLQSLFGDTNAEVVIYAGMIMAVFNLLNWTFGVVMITGDKSKISVKKALLNPNVIAIIVGVAAFMILKTPLKDLATEGTFADDIITRTVKTVDALGNMVTPLSMMVIGIKLAQMKFKDLFTQKWAYISSVYKLLVMAAITMLIVSFLPIDDLVKYALFFCLSMPSATATALFAVNFGSDGEAASVMVLLSTFLSVITIPLLSVLFGFLITLV